MIVDVQTCVDEALTLVELYSLCQTYLVQPLGMKLSHSMIEAKLQDPDRFVRPCCSNDDDALHLGFPFAQTTHGCAGSNEKSFLLMLT